MPAGMKGTRMADTSLRLPLDDLQWLTQEAERSEPRVSRNSLIVAAIKAFRESKRHGAEKETA